MTTQPDRQNGNELLDSFIYDFEGKFRRFTDHERMWIRERFASARAAPTPARDAAEGVERDVVVLLEHAVECLQETMSGKTSKIQTAIGNINLVKNTFRDTSPPKPAPDAMREAHDALQGLITWAGATREGLTGHIDERLAFEHELETAKKVREKILAASVPPADGVRQWPRVLNVKRAENAWHAEISFARHPTDAELLALEISLRDDRLPTPNLSPPCAGAAEPAAWQHRIRPTVREKWSHWRDGKAAPTDWQFENRPLFATPPVRGDREAIARVICEADAFDYDEEKDLAKRMSAQSAREIIDRAHRYADALIAAGLALHVQPGAGERK